MDKRSGDQENVIGFIDRRMTAMENGIHEAILELKLKVNETNGRVKKLEIWKAMFVGVAAAVPILYGVIKLVQLIQGM